MEPKFDESAQGKYQTKSSKNGNSAPDRSISDEGFYQTRLVFEIKNPYYLIDRLAKVKRDWPSREVHSVAIGYT